MDVQQATATAKIQPIRATFRDRAATGLKYGIPVTPLHGKRPYLRAWEDRGFTTQEEVDDHDRKYKTDNAGLVAKAEPGGFCVLEVDSPEVAKRYKQDTGEDLPNDTLMVASRPELGRGHRWFRHTEASISLGNISQDDVPQGDFSFRAHNEQAVAPHSLHPDTGNPYKLVRDVSPIPIPDQLVAWLATQSKKRFQKADVPTNAVPTNADAPDTLSAAPTHKIPHGQIYGAVIKQAGKLWREGYPPDSIPDVLVAWAHANCEPPIDEAKVRQYARGNGWKNGDGVKAVPEPKSNAVESTIVLESFADVQAKPVIWLWRDRIPKAKLTVFSGNPDMGKSTVLCDVIARYTTGRDYPDGAPNTIGGAEVLMMIAEDDPADTVKPRLMAAGADLSRVHRLKAVEIIRVGGQDAKKQERMLALDTDLALLEETLAANPQIKLVTIDPITSYIGKADLNKEQELRRVLGPLKELAERTGVTFIVLGHFNKRADVSALHKVGGAVAMSGVARAVWMFAKDPKADDEYLMLRGKCNLTKKRKGMKYRIGTKELLGLGGQPFIVWGTETDDDADSVLAMERNPEEKGKAKAKQFLLDYLATGEASAKGVLDEATMRKIRRNDVYDAKKELGVTQRWNGRESVWALPSAPAPNVEPVEVESGADDLLF